MMFSKFSFSTPASLYLRSQTCYLLNSCGSRKLTTSSQCFSTQKAAQPEATNAQPGNEPVLEYGDETQEARQKLDECLREFQSSTQEVPIVIDGKEYRTDNIRHQRIPFDHSRQLARFYYATEELIHEAIHVSMRRKAEWRNVPVERKVELFRRAADLVSGKYRPLLNAATMLGQAKTARQAEIDSAAELADFLRFNAYYLGRLAEFSQPISPEGGQEINETRFRPLEGFVAAISPFNFTAIGGNLATAPTLLGNCIVWKPSDTAVLSNYIIMKLLNEAGFPDGLINFVPCEGLSFGRTITSRPELGGINFTGSLATFQWLWNEVGLRIRDYNSFPRLVGECGGKNFHLIHESANIDVAVAQTIRSAFEYSGQKCSACSRLYVPKTLWKTGMRDRLVSIASEQLKLGPATDFSVYLSAVIDESSFRKIAGYLRYAEDNHPDLKILCGGKVNGEVGYYIEPTIIETNNPTDRLMQEELFGPVLTVYPYEETEVDKILELIDSSAYALTGAVFARDENFIRIAQARLNVGNFYVNDKSTGAIVGQQPFGGWRHSGTNDKAGGPNYLLRWSNQQTIKRTRNELITNY